MRARVPGNERGECTPQHALGAGTLALRRLGDPVPPEKLRAGEGDDASAPDPTAAEVIATAAFPCTGAVGPDGGNDATQGWHDPGDGRQTTGRRAGSLDRTSAV